MIRSLFTGNAARHDGIAPINIHLMRLVYGRMLAFLGKDSWTHGRLAGSAAEGMTFAFAWVLLPIVAVPWPYVVHTFLPGRASTAA
jgi:hypothetical protein